MDAWNDARGTIGVGTREWVADRLSPPEEITQIAEGRILGLMIHRGVSSVTLLAAVVIALQTPTTGLTLAGLALAASLGRLLVIGRGWVREWRTADAVAQGNAPPSDIVQASHRHMARLASLQVVGLAVVGLVVAGVLVDGRTGGTAWTLITLALLTFVLHVGALWLPLAPRPIDLSNPPAGTSAWRRVMTPDRREAEARRLRHVVWWCGTFTALDVIAVLVATTLVVDHQAVTTNVFGWVGVAFLWAPPLLLAIAGAILCVSLHRTTVAVAEEHHEVRWLTGQADVALAGRYLVVVLALPQLVLVAVAAATTSVPLQAVGAAAWPLVSVFAMALPRPALRRPEAIARA